MAIITLLVAAGVALSISIIRMEQKNEYRIIEESRPLLDAVREMDEAFLTMIADARGFSISHQTAFEQQYGDAARAKLR